MKTRLLACLALALVLGSCQKDSKKPAAETAAAPEIIAEMETVPESRSTLSVDENGIGTILWTPSDAINVFFGTTGARYVSQNTQNAATAAFRTTDEAAQAAELEADNIWGLYPYDENATCDGSSVTTTLPAAQRGIPGTFNDDLYITLAHSTTSKLKFFNVCGGIKFSLTRSDIASVTFKGNNDEDIAGDISLTFVDGLPKATVVNGVKEITLTPRYGGTFEKDENYYIIALPVTLSAGFTITFTTENGTVGTFEYTDKPVTISRSRFSRKADFDTYASFVGINTLHYTTSDGQLLNLPHPDCFGAAIATHTYENGVGTITFDAPVTAIGHYAFSGCTTLTSITLPEGLTSIGESAFYNCKNLTSLTIPNTITSIGYHAFEYCTGLTSMIIPDGVTELGGGLFVNTNVTSVSLGTIVETTQMNSPLAGCKNLSVTIRDGVRSICDYAFSQSSFLASISLPESLTSIGRSAFSYCTGLTSFTIPSSVTSIDQYAFYNCTGLTTMDVPASVTSISPYTFQSCTGLTSVTLHDGLTAIGEYAFSYCKGLTSFTIPGTVTSIGNRAFENCTGLTSMYIPDSATELGGGLFVNTNVTSVSLGTIVETTQMNSPLAGCKNLSVTIRDGVSSIGDYAFSQSSFLASISLPESLTSIGRSAFYYCTGLTSFTIPSSVTSIGQYAFYNCTGLTTMDVPASVTSIAPYTFQSCKGLTSVTLHEGLTTISEYAFSYCSGLTAFTIPSTVSSIGNRAFENCTGLTSMIIPDSATDLGSALFINSSVTSVSLGAIVETTQMNSPLAGCKNLSVTIRDGVSSICEGAFSQSSSLTSISLPESLTSIGRSAFYYCTGLTSFTIPSSVTSIGQYAFYNCTGLTSMDVPTSVTSIASYTFQSCRNLTSITLHEGLTTISEYAFSYCSGLTAFIIPSTVSSIGNRAFEYCTGLTEFKCLPVTPPSAGATILYQASECPIYVPAASVEAYQAAQNWSTYASRIQAMI